jgi:hypothetical protein
LPKIPCSGCSLLYSCVAIWCISFIKIKPYRCGVVIAVDSKVDLLWLMAGTATFSDLLLQSFHSLTKTMLLIARALIDCNIWFGVHVFRVSRCVEIARWRRTLIFERGTLYSPYEHLDNRRLEQTRL